MKTLAKSIAFLWSLCGAAALTGCVATHSGQLLITPEAAGKAIYYVELSQSDSRNLAATIADRMQARGLNATAGPPGQGNPDYVVTYVDRWAWDMRMYLIDLRIELRDAKDRSIVGFGDSSQSSLAAMGKSYADVIDVALNELFRK